MIHIPMEIKPTVMIGTISQISRILGSCRFGIDI